VDLMIKLYNRFLELPEVRGTELLLKEMISIQFNLQLSILR